MNLFVRPSSSRADCRLLIANSFLYPVVALLFQLVSKLFAAGANDATAIEYMHEVRHDVVEQALVVRDEHDGVLRRAEFVDAIGDNAQRIYIEALVGLV